MAHPTTPPQSSAYLRLDTLAALVRGAHELLLLYDDSGQRIFVGPAERVPEHLGLSYEHLPARLRDLVVAEDRPLLDHMREAVRAAPGRTETGQLRAAAGWQVEIALANFLGDGHVNALVVHLRRLPYPILLARQDTLRAAALPSRASFAQSVREAIVRAGVDRRDGFSVLLIDLDRIKVLVGNYGQEVVESLQDKVAERVSGLLRPADVLAQLGVGELGAVLDGISDRDEVGRIAERIQHAVTTSYRVSGKLIRVTGVVGVATSERMYTDPEQVLRDAALACERARSRGRSRRAVFRTQMRLEDTMLLSLAGELHQAIYNEQLELHYQPIVSLQTGKLRGVEALLRWRHHLRGMVPPTQFIPIAEDSALIIPVGEWVLREACKRMANWQRAYPHAAELFVCVNLSAKQFASPGLTKQIDSALSGSGLDARHLKLEITESAVMEETDAAVALLRGMRDRGVGVSLDDFGTGYASFSYLHKLPYDTIKVDRSFVSRLHDDEQSQRIVEAIVGLAHNLQMNVVAEGIETLAQLQRLVAMGCEVGQGYHFAPALSAVDCIPLVSDERLLIASADYTADSA